jgi:hypothetical protein
MFDMETLTISLRDKIHNAPSILRNLRERGTGMSVSPFSNDR